MGKEIEKVYVEPWGLSGQSPGTRNISVKRLFFGRDLFADRLGNELITLVN
jgi:hypothetical protein